MMTDLTMFSSIVIQVFRTIGAKFAFFGELLMSSAVRLFSTVALAERVFY